MKLGVVYCCYGNPDYIDDCLKPWIEAKKSHDILIAAVHGQFKEYHDLGIQDNDKASLEKLHPYLGTEINYLYVQNSYEPLILNPKIYQTEAEIRDKGLQWLLKQNCDYILILDNDEFYTIEQIQRIIISLELNRDHDWFSIHFKNYVFDGKQWVAGFCPPRIFRVKASRGYNLSHFYWDNDVIYKHLMMDGTRHELSYKDFPSFPIPKNLLHIKHLTWLHSNGKLKYEYQMKHFGHCGYKWNYDTNQLEFNKEFYQKNNIPFPELIYES